jgi:MbnP
MHRSKTIEKKSTDLIRRFSLLADELQWKAVQKITGFFCCFMLMTSFQKPSPSEEASLMVHFQVYVHGEPLQLNKKYKNPFGEIFELNRFRFYIGKAGPLYTESGFKQTARPDYQLIDFSDSSSTHIEIPAYSGSACNGIQFQLGVDSAIQTKGAQSGVLDPVKGMFWTWNSGYLSFKMEGYSPISTQPAHIIAYHIGGYRYPNSTVWNIKINTTNEEVFRITRDSRLIVEVPIELDYFFDGPTPLHIKEIPACTTPGQEARNLSENFVASFTGLTLISNK